VGLPYGRRTGASKKKSWDSAPCVVISGVYAISRCVHRITSIYVQSTCGYGVPHLDLGAIPSLALLYCHRTKLFTKDRSEGGKASWVLNGADKTLAAQVVESG
jgi:hypothetical protein